MAEEINLEDEIKRLLRREPFVPFFVRLTSGERLEVASPYQMAIGDGNTVAIMRPRAGGIFIRQNQIVAVDTPEPAR
jgi:hypothetical protein